jgi:CheY-like chemotaxis protein
MVALDETEAAALSGMAPGWYIRLAINDTGCGMDAALQEHIFEPFFSTKGAQGTGLGLATVYGIVKQHGGHIQVDSLPGKGSTFILYLPATDDSAIQSRPAETPSSALTGSETILLVEDNEPMRNLSHTILRRQGYRTLVAKNGPDALAVLESHPGPVDLLLTDVVMPDMNGRELFDRIVAKIPEMKVLYMSGYTDNVIAHHGVLDPGVQFIQKPFSVHALASKIRAVLDQPLQ